MQDHLLFTLARRRGGSWARLATASVVMLCASCRPTLPPSLDKLAETAEQVSIPSRDPLQESFTVGELRVTARVQGDRDRQRVSKEDYAVTLGGRLISTLHCTTMRGFWGCKAYNVACEDNNRLRVYLAFSDNNFSRGAVWTTAADYAIEAEQSADMSVFRIYPSRMDPETNAHSRIPGTETVAALVHQPLRDIILVEPRAPQSDSLWVGIAMLLGAVGKIHYHPRWQEICNPGIRLL